jgi:hypothetical protein
VGASGDMDWLAKVEDRNERVKVKGGLLIANDHPKRDGQSRNDRGHNKKENTTDGGGSTVEYETHTVAKF